MLYYVLWPVLLGLIPASIAYYRGLSIPLPDAQGPDVQGAAEWRGLLGWWVAGAFLFIVVLPMSLFMGTSDKAEKVEPAVTKCDACGGSTSAKSCPHCGHIRGRASGQAVRRVAVPIGVSALVVLVIVGSEMIPASTFLGVTGMPSCDSASAEESVKKVMEDAPLRKVFGLKIVDFADVQTIGSTGTVVSCAANVTLNNTSIHRMTYSFTKREKDYWVEAKLEN